jgi:hypothetical protein
MSSSVHTIQTKCVQFAMSHFRFFFRFGKCVLYATYVQDEKVSSDDDKCRNRVKKRKKKNSNDFFFVAAAAAFFFVL